MKAIDLNRKPNRNKAKQSRAEMETHGCHLRAGGRSPAGQKSARVSDTTRELIRAANESETKSGEYKPVNANPQSPKEVFND
jgi:hypothetical protein